MTRLLRGIFILTPLVLFLVTPACSKKTDEWKGRILMEGDVVVVKNPSEPLFGPGALALEEDLAVGGEESADYVFADISSIAVADNGTIFVLDFRDKNIKVFARDGKFLRAFGKAGQGPGELALPRSIHINGRGEVVVVDVRRCLTFFKPSGEFVRSVSAAALNLADACPADGGNFFVYLIDFEGSRYELRKVDGELKDLFMVESSPLQDSARDGFDPLFPVLRWALLSGGRVVCGHAVRPELRIRDASGRLVRKIQMEMKAVPVAKEDVDERTEGMPPDRMKDMKIPKHFPAFRYFVTDDEDRIYVLSWERPPGRQGSYFDIFDREGKYIARAVLPAVQPLIRKGRLYATEETEDGFPVLRRYKMTWNFKDRRVQ